MRLLAILLLLTLGCSPHSGGWSVAARLQNEQHRHMELLGLHFSSPETGWTVGYSVNVESGLLASSPDAGENWKLHASGIDPDHWGKLVSFSLNGVHFLDPLNGWVVGNGGTILHTSDGGQTWEIQRYGRIASHLFDVLFQDASTGWVAGLDGVMVTRDGGKTWTRSRGDKYWEFRSLAQPADLWAVGEIGTVARSRDGGESFEKVSIPALRDNDWLVSQHWVDAEHGHLVGQSHNRVNALLFRTTDGGATWTRTIVPDYESAGAVWFLSADEGWVAVEDSADQGRLLHTRDGGKTWEAATPLLEGRITALTFCDAEHGYGCTSEGEVLRYSR